jgi:hypothetical protein
MSRTGKAAKTEYVETPEQRRLSHEAFIEHQNDRISTMEYLKRCDRIERGLIAPNGEMKALAPVIDPKCPRCAEALVKLECPPGFSMATWCWMRPGDFACPNCVKLQEAGRLSFKAKTEWFASFFRKQAK